METGACGRSWLPAAIRELYRAAVTQPGSHRFAEIAQVGIGYVSGDNDFFHLRPSEAERWGIPTALLHPSVRNGRALPARQITAKTVEGWRAADAPGAVAALETRRSGACHG